MANTYTLIEAKTLGTTTASVTFSSIPATYTDLSLVMSGRTNDGGATGTWSTFEFNGSVAPSGIYIFGAGSGTPSSGTAHKAPLENGGGSTANTFSNAWLYIPNYANTSYNKSYSVDGVVETNGTEAYQALIAGLISTTNAINAIKITPGSGSYVQYSSFYLYGIKNS
jgi:hypothetical protein